MWQIVCSSKERETTRTRPHNSSDEVRAEIAARIYFLREGNASCDICKEEWPDVFNHCVICNNNGSDVYQACLDKGIKYPGNHPLVYTDENAVNEAPSEGESIFPVTDPLDELDVDDQQSTIRTLTVPCSVTGGLR